MVLAFEDLQWADTGLLEFIDYLLEWSAERPIFVLALGRPELLDARPGWAAARSCWHRCPTTRCASCSTASCRGFPRSWSAGSWRAPRGCRCTRWRRCGCCSTAAC